MPRYKIEAEATVLFEKDVFLDEQEYEKIKNDKNKIKFYLSPGKDIKEIKFDPYIKWINLLQHRYCAKCGKYLGELHYGHAIDQYCNTCYKRLGVY